MRGGVGGCQAGVGVRMHRWEAAPAVPGMVKPTSLRETMDQRHRVVAQSRDPLLNIQNTASNKAQDRCAAGRPRVWERPLAADKTHGQGASILRGDPPRWEKGLTWVFLILKSCDMKSGLVGPHQQGGLV